MKQSKDIADALASRAQSASRRAALPIGRRSGEDASQQSDGEEIGTPLAMVLLVDDDCIYRNQLSRYVRANGFDALEADSFAAAAAFVQAYDAVSVIVAELTVGSRHLFDHLSEIRRPPGASVLVLSGRRDDTEKIVALELGADDFIPKTADRREILARIRAAARRLVANFPAMRRPESASAHAAAEADGSWRFLRAARKLIDPDGLPIRLTAAEFSLLEAFVENIGRPLSRSHLATVALGRNSYRHDRGIDNLVAKLRRKLRDSAKLGRMIKTARPVGYVFTGFDDTATESAPDVSRRNQRRRTECRDNSVTPS